MNLMFSRRWRCYVLETNIDNDQGTLFLAYNLNNGRSSPCWSLKWWCSGVGETGSSSVPEDSLPVWFFAIRRLQPYLISDNKWPVSSINSLSLHSTVTDMFKIDLHWSVKLLLGIYPLIKSYDQLMSSLSFQECGLGSGVHNRLD